jgi:hypothetical protein
MRTFGRIECCFESYMEAGPLRRENRDPLVTLGYEQLLLPLPNLYLWRGPIMKETLSRSTPG